VDKFGDSVGGRRNNSKGRRALRFWRDDPSFLFTTANSSALLLDVCSPRHENPIPTLVLGHLRMALIFG
jgi:hypothetical protein